VTQLAKLDLPSEINSTGAVLWLDDAERFLRVGDLSVPLLRQLRDRYPDLVIVATIRDHELEDLLDSSRTVRLMLRDGGTKRFELAKELTPSRIRDRDGSLPRFESKSTVPPRNGRVVRGRL
jgi:hypothetical protein